jgi:hypothetical protein
MRWRTRECPSRECTNDRVEKLSVKESERIGLGLKFGWRQESVRRYRCPACNLIWVDGEDVDDVEQDGEAVQEGSA